MRSETDRFKLQSLKMSTSPSHGARITEGKQMENEMFYDYPDVVTPYQLQEMLGGVSLKQEYKLLKSGEIHSVRLGHCYRIPKISVIKFLTEE